MTRPLSLAELRNSIRLQVSISTIFAQLIVPALGSVIAFSYIENTSNLTVLSHRLIDQARDRAVETSRQILEPVAGTLRMVAATEKAMPGFYRSDEGADFLYNALVSAPQIDAVDASFENGYHRVLIRMDADGRRSDPASSSVQLAYEVHRRLHRGRRPAAPPALPRNMAQSLGRVFRRRRDLRRAHCGPAAPHGPRNHGPGRHRPHS